jgi:AcrR family transcriptional regulator
MADQVRGPRARYREQTRGEIKAVAVRQLAEGGVAGVALLRIAKEIGMSGPALYRYFASRDELLAEVVLDAYKDAAEAIHAVDVSAGGRSSLHGLAAAYRGWGKQNPHLYQLLEGTPVPGFEPPAETVMRARAVLGPFLSVFARGRPLRTLDELMGQFGRWLRKNEEVAAWVAEWTGLSAQEPAAAVALTGAIMVWPQMHGTVGLETAGQFADMGHEPATLLATQIDILADAFQLD